jgi:predicted dehydrogenase
MKRLVRAFLVLLIGLVVLDLGAEEARPPFRIAIVGLAHDHAQGFLGDLRRRQDIELVGIAEANPVLVARYRERYQLPAALFYPDLETMLAATKVPAVAVCSSTFDHVDIIRRCAARGVHVMVEKPLATTLDQAREIVAIAQRSGIHVIVNYETTWHPAMQALPEARREIGDIRKIVVHDGHQGPKEIGASAEFLAWLTDPRLNGGGALMDFGCYGADLITWLMEGRRPVAVTAVTQQIKPAVYPRVDDEATIILTYPHAQGIIQASWNWPYGRKDLELYGTTGSILAPQRNVLRVRVGQSPEREQTLAPLAGLQSNPLTYFAAVVRGEVQPAGLSGLEINLVAMEILDAARESARTGKTVGLSPAR